MRITERRLRKVIRSVIKESVFKDWLIAVNVEVGDHVRVKVINSLITYGDPETGSIGSLQEWVGLVGVVSKVYKIKYHPSDAKKVIVCNIIDPTKQLRELIGVPCFANYITKVNPKNLAKHEKAVYDQINQDINRNQINQDINYPLGS